MNFASDNCAGTHPAIMAAIAAANEGVVASYGEDALSHAARDALRALLDAPEAGVFFVASGTAANALSLAALTPPYGRIFCHREAHIETSECGAVEQATGGAKLTLIDGEDGRIDADALDRAVSFWAGEGLGGSQPAAVSITNTTEQGTLYHVDQIREIGAICDQHRLGLHLDGARFAQAVAATNAAPADLTHRAGVDALSFGGTKNGCMGVEAVVIFDPERAERLDWLRKRGGHLLSKHRYLAAQFYAMCEGGLWLDLARHANAMAADLAERMATVDELRLIRPVASSQLFVAMPSEWADRARAAGAMFHDWPEPGLAEGESSVRLVTHWASREEDNAALIAALTGG